MFGGIGTHLCLGVTPGSELKKYSGQAQGTIWDIWDRTPVSHLQDKCLNSCGISQALESRF